MPHSHRCFAAAVVFTALTAFSSSAWSQLAEDLGDITTPAGKSFYNAKVIAVEPDGIRLRHESGVSKVLFADLPADVASRYPHDPAKAAAFAAKAEATNREAIRIAEQERAMAAYNERCRRAGLPPNFYIPEEGPITIDQVKGRWLLENVANYPTFGDRDRVQREGAIEYRKQMILSGALDRDAEKIALRHNLDWYLHNDQIPKAEVARQRLADMQKEETSRAELEVLERLAESVSKLASEASYRSDIVTELARFRSELERNYPPVLLSAPPPHHHHKH
jgi:hypothetical protein